MTPAAVSTLVCPACRWPLEFDGRLAGGKLDSGALRCGRGWPGRDGLPRLIDEDGVRRADRFMRVLYDWLAPLGDPLTRALFPPLRGSPSVTLPLAAMRTERAVFLGSATALLLTAR